MIHMETNAQALYLIDRLNKAGFEAYLVGGCVRSWLLGNEPNDWDIATSATPQQVHDHLSDIQLIDTGIQHGTVSALVEDSRFEITTFRCEGPYLDARRPSSVLFVHSITEDLARRDFTINAMAYHPQHGLVDPFGGRQDLDQKLLRAVGEPAVRIKEDALRIMRALRFASTLGLSIVPDLAQALHKHRESLGLIAAERIRDELMNMLVGENILAVLLEYPDVLAVPIPEIEPGIGFDQHTPYHCYGVWEHTAYAIAASVPDPLVRLTLLFHDVGKPAQFVMDEDGAGHFYGHDSLSAELATTRLRALRFDADTVKAVYSLIKWHGVKLRAENIPRWLNRLGIEGLRNLIEVKRGDILAHSELHRQERLIGLDEAQQALEEYLTKEPCFTRASLAVNGNDLMELGVQAGPRLGALLNILLDDVLDNKIENERAVLLSTAREFIDTQG